MSGSGPREDARRRRAAHLKPSSRTTNTSGSGSHGFQNSSSVGYVRCSLSLGGGSRKHLGQVLDSEGNDVTPLPLLNPPTGPTRACRFFVDEICGVSASEQNTASRSFILPFSRSTLGSSRLSSQSTIESLNEEIEDTFSKQEAPGNFTDLQRRRDTVRAQVMEDMLDQVVDVIISETDCMTLLDVPSVLVLADAEDAQMVSGELQEAAVDGGGKEKKVDRATQTLNGAPKNKQAQTQSRVLVDAATSVTAWDVSDVPCDPELLAAAAMPEHTDAAVDSRGAAEGNESVSSMASTGSVASSMRESDVSLNSQTDLQLVLQTEAFRQCLSVMERIVLQNVLQCQLAAYRQLAAPGEGAAPEGSPTPALELLWTFSCELSRGRSVTAMAWNKQNPDLLAVGYGPPIPTQLPPGLVCCWSFKNTQWPERVISLDSAVTSLDFSSVNPSHLAVGMRDGTIAVHAVHSRGSGCVVSNRESSKKPLGPVWQLRWTRQELISGKEEVETLVSVTDDGRMSKWFVCNSGLECTDLLNLRRLHSSRKPRRTKTEKKPEFGLLPVVAAALCFDLHPTDPSVFLAGTWEGLIYRGSCSHKQQVMETYRKHFCPVNGVWWNPIHAEVFLSCSSDWTIQLWRWGQPAPILSISSDRTVVHDVRWVPRRAAAFAAIRDRQLEIWDLSISILDPVVVQPAPPGVKMTSLLFGQRAECVLAGHSDGQVTVYLLKNLDRGEADQVHLHTYGAEGHAGRPAVYP